MWGSGDGGSCDAFLCGFGVETSFFSLGEVLPGHVGSQYPAALIGYGDIFVEVDVLPFKISKFFFALLVAPEYCIGWPVVFT